MHSSAGRLNSGSLASLPVLFKRELDVHQLTFAMGETVAHLNLLWHAGQLQRRRGGDGILRFGIRTA